MPWMITKKCLLEEKNFSIILIGINIEFCARRNQAFAYKMKCKKENFLSVIKTTKQKEWKHRVNEFITIRNVLFESKQ